MSDKGQTDDAQTLQPPAKRPKLRNRDKEKVTAEYSLSRSSSDTDLAVARGSGDHTWGCSFLQKEMEKKIGNNMPECEIMDQVAADDDDMDEEGDWEQNSDDSMDDGELHALLDEGLTKDSITHSDSEQCVQKEKVVLVQRGHDHFDILPEGWLVVTHDSGMPVYLHRQSRVCTLAQPYFLGSGSVRKHDVPISAVPCLKYRRVLQKEKQGEEVLSGQSVNRAENGETTPSDQQGRAADLAEDVNSTNTAQNSSESTTNATNAAQSSSENTTNATNTTQNSYRNTIPEKKSREKVKNTTPTEKWLKPEKPVAVCPFSMKNSSPSVGAKAEDAASLKDRQQDAAMAGPSTEAAGEGASSQPDDKKETEAEPSGSRPDLTNPFPSLKIKSAGEVKKETSLDFLKLREYCQELFEFKTVTVRRYKTWRARRNHMRSKRPSRPELPSNTKLITCSVPTSLDKSETKVKEFFLNPSGKSSVTILHEYVQHTMKVQPVCVFKELENSKMPFSAIVKINNIEYGTGCAVSKKLAKNEAAKNTLKILIPEMNALTDDQLEKNSGDLSFFDEIKIEDTRVRELGNKAGQPSPYEILLECLSRNYGMVDTDCRLEIKPMKNKSCEFTITVGKHKATVSAKSKISGKQRAAQAILQKLHPHVTNWGSLLRLYGNTANRVKCAKRTEERMEVNDVEVKRHHPNQAILDKLREAMRKLSAQRDAIKSHGRLVVNRQDLPK